MADPPPPPPSPRVNAPNLGLYYTLDNVENSLPRIPGKKLKRNPYDSAGSNQARTDGGGGGHSLAEDTEKRIANMMKEDMIPRAGNTKYPNRFATRADRIYSKGQQDGGKGQEGKNFELTPWYLVPLASPTADRANGRAARVVKIGLRSADGKRAEVHVIFLLYQMMVGAIGGIVAGIESGYLSPNLQSGEAVIGKPGQLPLPPTSTFHSGLAGTALLVRSCKRAVMAGILFNFVEKNFEQYRNKSDWRNFAYAGVVCGAIYGARGGPRGCMTGSGMFGAFAGLSGFYEELKRKSKMK